MYITAYRTPSNKTRDARVLDMISSILSGGKSSRLHKKLLMTRKWRYRLQHSARVRRLRYVYNTWYSNARFTRDQIQAEIDAEIKDLQTNLISEREYQKLQNEFENSYVHSNSDLESLAENLATYYLLNGDINLINEEINIYRSITREEIREVAKKYLQPNSVYF
ncbi:M16 family metallopeptidase [Paenimyroides ceti]|uniref:M16 family metallopeptidase n=1 Tax=Paenimyroides ceti TaxID=395087 RepID=UPI0037CAA2B5